jgi:hypothetical protein
MCNCHDGIVCDICASEQITQAMSTPPNPTLAREEVQLLEEVVNEWLDTLLGVLV